jgi:3-isopropylmalate/(R)-2-methylmalate dehydratase large subunit
MRLSAMNNMAGKTLFDKIWDAHIVEEVADGPQVIYIDRHLIHEVTSPQAFAGIEKRGVPLFRPKQTIATADHNVPTKNQHLPIQDPLSRNQVDTLIDNCRNHDVELYGLGHPNQGIVHVIGPELGITQPGMTIVCGDSHTSTHGAFGCIAFGIGTSEVEQVFSTQCILQTRPKTMRINVNGKLNPGVGAKDIILYIISQLSTSGGTGYFVEFAGSAIENLSMEGRMTVCNMSIELGARGGMIAPDEVTFQYLAGRKFAPKDSDWDARLSFWRTLHTDENAVFNKEIYFDAANIEPMITYGTNPAMGVGISQALPMPNGNKSFARALDYMRFAGGESILNKEVDFVFIGSCTNSRIEDLREVAAIVKGKRKADNITAWIVPGSKHVEMQAKQEGLDKVLEEAGFELREPGCSACLAMNEDKIPAGKYCVSTSNRNFEGRQGPGSRTLLASPATAAVTALTGKITDVRQFLN